MKRIDEINLENKKVIIRVDYNVPLDNNLNIIDDNRIKESLKTIKYCLDKNCSIILLSHTFSTIQDLNNSFIAKSALTIIMTSITYFVICVPLIKNKVNSLLNLLVSKKLTEYLIYALLIIVNIVAGIVLIQNKKNKGR